MVNASESLGVYVCNTGILFLFQQEQTTKMVATTGTVRYITISKVSFNKY